VPSPPGPSPSFRGVFALGEFRALWLSYVLSAAGDRLALVALTLLVYSRSRSPLLAAVTFAAGLIPYLAGGMLLSGLADRLPRRAVMIGCDLARCALVLVMLWPGAPLAVMIALLYGVTVLQPPFDAARSAAIRDITGGGLYPLAAAVLQSTALTVMITGSAAGGLITAFFGARPALAADAATFIASAVLVRAGTRARPAAAPGPAGAHPLAQAAAGARLVLGNRELRTLVCLGWLAAFYVVPEGIAAPYAASLGGGPVTAGLLITASQAGAAVAVPVFARLASPRTRLRWMGPMAVAACAVLLAAGLRPGLAATVAVLAASSACTAYQVAANTAFVERLPGGSRGQAFGVASAGLVAGQGAAFAIAGAAASIMPPWVVTAASGGLGVLAACALAPGWRRLAPAVGRHAARRGRFPGTAKQPRGRPPAGAGPAAARGQVTGRYLLCETPHSFACSRS
jgi:MFS family permease